MNILSEKTVITRKSHCCDACGRKFPQGTKMYVQVNTIDGIQAWRTCETCTELLIGFRERFDDGCGVCYNGCVADALNKDQTPEDLLTELKGV
jgi:hypothetical protein